MKKILIAAAALTLGVTAFAQQALFGGPNVESPVINADGTVTVLNTYQMGRMPFPIYSTVVVTKK